MKKRSTRIGLDIGSFRQVDQFLCDLPPGNRLIVKLEEKEQDTLADYYAGELDSVHGEPQRFVPLLFGLGLGVRSFHPF